MNDSLISIDLGTAYTKVALRRELGEDAVLAQDPNLGLNGGLDISIPTVAAHALRRGHDHWWFGSDVAKLDNGSSQIDVYRNWKPELLSKALDAGDLHRGLALGYFRWLRHEFLPSVAARLDLDLDQATTRLAIPALPIGEDVQRSLLGIMSEAGFHPAATAPLIAEPVANAIGVFSRGRNIVWQPDPQAKPRPQLGKMFEDSTFLDAVRARTLEKSDLADHWALVVDLGGFTTDCAMIGFDVEVLDAPLEGELQGKPRLAAQSWVMGIAELDRRLIGQLPEDKGLGLLSILRHPDSRRLEAVHRTLYGERRPYTLANGQTLGQGEESDVVETVLWSFAAEVAHLVETFLTDRGYDRVDTLILTGGGLFVRPVSDRLCARLSQFGVQGVYLPGPSAHLPLGGTLSPELVRGGTALGAGSIYFDFRTG
ncbi:MAG: hypothetical protein AAGA48_06180 [Myxococcota bacterium]